MWEDIERAAAGLTPGDIIGGVCCFAIPWVFLSLPKLGHVLGWWA